MFLVVIKCFWLLHFFPSEPFYSSKYHPLGNRQSNYEESITRGWESYQCGVFSCGFGGRGREGETAVIVEFMDLFRTKCWVTLL